MVIPKAACCSSNSSRPSTSQTKKATKSSKPSSVSPKNKTDEALKRRLKKLLDKESTVSSKSDKFEPSESKQIKELLLSSDVQKFILNAAKKEVKGTKKNNGPIKKVDQNKNHIKKAKTASKDVAKSSTSRDCSDGTCALVRKPKAAVTKKTVDTSTSAAKKTAATSTSSAKKTIATSTSAGKKQIATSTGKKKLVASKKTATASIRKPTTKKASKRGQCRPSDDRCNLDSSSDEDDDDDDDDSYDDCPYNRDDSDDDSDDGGGCSGGACGRRQKPSKGNGKGGNMGKRRKSSGSWETDSDSNDGNKYSKRMKSEWQCEKLKSTIDTSLNLDDTRWSCENSEVILKDFDQFYNTDKSQCEPKRLSNGNEKNTKFEIQSAERNGQAEKSKSVKSEKIMKQIDTSKTKNSKKSIDEKSVDALPETEGKSKIEADIEINKNKSKVSAKKKKELLKEKKSNAETCDDDQQNSLVPYVHNGRELSDSDSIDSEYDLFRSWDEVASTASSDLSYEGEDYFSTDSNNWYNSSDEEYESFSGEEEAEDECDSYDSSSSSNSTKNSSDDEDYQLPDGVEEDILIRPGEANIYDATEDIQFDSDDSSAQIFEIKDQDNDSFTDSTSQDQQSKNDKEMDQVDAKSDSSGDSCPKLVPIDFTKHEEFEEDSAMDDSSIDGYSDSSQFSDDSGEIPSNMEAEIITANSPTNAPPEILSSSFINGFGCLDFNTSFENATNSTQNNSFGFEVFMQRKNPKQKYRIVSVSDKKMKETEKKCDDVGLDDTFETPNDALSSKFINKKNKTRKSQTELTTQPNAEANDVVKETKSIFFASLNTYQVLLLLKSPIYLHGAVRIKLIAGNVEVFGYKFSPNETCEMFSPRGNNLLSIQPMENSKENQCNDKLSDDLNNFKRDFNQKDIDYILRKFDTTKHAVVLLERNDTTNRIRMVNKYIREEVFPPAYVDTKGPYYISEFILRSRFFEKCRNSVYIDPVWNSVNLVNTSKLLVVGGKGVGKSTFLRYTINNNLRKFKKFLLIDLDIGQPEIFAPQTISATIIDTPILGPGYFYGKIPLRSYLYGDINVVLSPHSYLLNVQELLKYCHNENQLKGIPWIINTMGYNKGFGAELLALIIEHLQPTDVVQLQSPKHYNNFEYPMSSEVVREIPRNIFGDEKRIDIFDYRLFVFNSVVPSRQMDNSEYTQMAAKDIRLTMMTSMLGSLLSERDEWLTDVRPYCVSVDDLNIICIGEETLSKADLLDAINSNIVYLCDNSSNALECYGIGLVRGVDKYQQTIYLLPSVSAEILARVNTIAVCNIPLPTSFILNQGPKIKGVVPYTYNTNDFISSKHVPEHIYRPQNFLQGSRNILLEQ